MAQPLQLFAQNYGVLRRQQLLDHGFTTNQISRGLREGNLSRLRNGWYTLTAQPPHPHVATAVRAGGALSGSFAIAMRGGWDLRSTVVVHRVARQEYARWKTNTVVLRRFEGRRVAVRDAVDPVDLAFEVCLLTLSKNDLICVADSLVRRKLLSIDEMRAIAARYGAPVRRVIDRVNDKADSGLETYVRLWLESKRIRFRQQVPVVIVNGRLDFLIGNQLVLEVDGAEHHSSRVDRQKDYTRDQILQSVGYIVFRVTYDDVIHDWDTVSARLLEMIRRGDHRMPPKGLR